MRTHLHFLTILFLSLGGFGSGHYCTAQSDSVWFQPGSKWIYDALSFGGGPGKEYLSHAGLDTVGGKECHRLRWYGYQQPHYQLPPSFETWPDQFAYATNDSVFLWYDDEWVQIYDFTLTTGDTMLLPFASEFLYAVIEETGLDTVWNIPVRFQKWRKKHVEDSIYDYRITVYERLGGEHLLSDAFDLGAQVFEVNYYLECFRDIDYPDLACQDLLESTYVRFPISATSWSEEESFWCSDFGYRFLQNGSMPFDTFIPGGGVGKKLYIQSSYIINDPCPDPSSENFQSPPILIGLLDQHYLSKQIYFMRLADYDRFPVCIPGFDDPFPLYERVLLYDFDLDVGDILPWKSLPNQVIAIDSVKFPDNVWRRRFHFSDLGEDIWIEGMGSVKGLLSPYYNYQITDVTCGTLHCFASEELLYHTVEEWMCDSIISAVLDYHAVIVQSPVFPNPANAFISFDVPDEPILTELVCSVYDHLGEEILSETLDVSRRLDVSSLPTALYFFTLSDRENQPVISGRFIKQ